MSALLWTFAALVVLVAALYAVGALRWSAGTRELRGRLQAARTTPPSVRVDFAELVGLPAPAARYFQTVLQPGQPIVASARLEHRGHFNMSEAGAAWKPFSSEQRVTIQPPGFDWNARIDMAPGVFARVHDAYIAREGVLYAAALGLVPIVNLRGAGEIARGELMRFFAEAAWYPTALLPSQGVRWEAVDARSARATLSDGPHTLTLLFVFDEAGLIETVRADARGRTVGDRIIQTPWQGRFWNYERRAGMLVPLEGEVSWVLPEGVKPYWRGRVTNIEYEFGDR